jgi:hypothetical protein
MATSSFTVTTYEVTLCREMSMGVVGATFYACITCRSSGGDRFCLYFMRPDSPAVDNIYDPITRWGSAYLTEEQFPWYIDLLRNEKPVYAYLNSEKPIWNRLFTGPEPVGEGEK